MDNKTVEFLSKIASALERMSIVIESGLQGEGNEIQKLTFKLEAERAKVAELEAKLSISESKTKKLEGASQELADIRAARSRDLEELGKLMAEIKPLIEDENHA